MCFWLFIFGPFHFFIVFNLLKQSLLSLHGLVYQLLYCRFVFRFFILSSFLVPDVYFVFLVMHAIWNICVVVWYCIGFVTQLSDVMFGTSLHNTPQKRTLEIKSQIVMDHVLRRC